MRDRLPAALACACVIVCLLAPTAAWALIFASPDSEPDALPPADFPYWENVVQRRYEGPSVVYLGAGWALTARHVGSGEILLGDEILEPRFGSRHTLLNEDGTGADALVFGIEPTARAAELPLVPIAREAARVGERVLLVGFGREREKVIAWDEGGRDGFGFVWSSKGAKRWGTNRVVAVDERVEVLGRSTRIFTFRFDPPHSAETTPYESQAAVGDSGGAVFVKREGEWQLAGIMISVSTLETRPEKTTFYGDTTFAADVTYYRSEIQRWARPACANELDDDGDDKVDFPLDPDCHSPQGISEHDGPATATETRTAWALGAIGAGLLLGLIIRSSRRRGAS